MEDDDVSWMDLEIGTPVVDVRRATVNKKRSKLIMLDDLLREREKKKKQRSKNVEDSCSASDDEDDTADQNVQIVKKMLKDLESESVAVDEKVSLLKWGERVFHSQKPFAEPITSGDCFGLFPGGSLSAKGMLLSGMLRSLVISEGRCNENTTRWIYSQMVQSPSEPLEKAACHFLCDLVRHERLECTPGCKLEWLPNFEEIMDVFGSYGYRKAPPMEDTNFCTKQAGSRCPDEMSIHDLPPGSDQVDGPPPNIRSFVAFLTSLFQARNFYQTLSASEAENLVVLLAHCQLDRRIENISLDFRSCLKALVHYFTEEEWAESCPRIATSFSSISSNYLNQLRAAKSLHAGDSRLCSLQRLVVIQLLGRSVKKDMNSAAEVVSIFNSIKTKKKDFDFLNLFHQLTSADLYLWSEPAFEQNGLVRTDWLDFLKKCTLNISSSDERPHATKARNWASFLWQKFQFEKKQS